MADLMKALQWLIEGKKIRHEDWHKSEYIYIDEILKDENGRCSPINFEVAEGWNIFNSISDHCCTSPSGLYQCINSPYAEHDCFGFKHKSAYPHIICSVNFCPYCGKKAVE